MRKALAAAPREGVLRALTAYVMLAMGDASSAERELRQARDDGAADHVVLTALFPLMFSRHEEEQLLAEFAEPAAGAKGEQAADILFGRGKALLSLDRLPEARAAMDRCLSLRRDAAGLVVRANIASRENDKALAVKLLDEAFRLDPKNGAATAAKLKLLQEAGDTAKLLAFSEQMLGVFPDAIELRRARIEVFLNLKQDANAKAETNALLKSLPNSNFGKYYMAVLMARANNKKGAWEVMQVIPPQFVKQYPECAIPMAQLAVDNGHVDFGMTILANAISANPGLLEARLLLANLRLSQNTPQGALSVLSPVKDSTDPRVQKLIGNIRAKIAKDRAF
jgi:tetratricopeptide (TPR) repeat protein